MRNDARAARVVYGDGSSEPLEVARPTARVRDGISGFFVYEVTPSCRDRKPIRFEPLDGVDRLIGASKISPEAR